MRTAFLAVWTFAAALPITAATVDRPSPEFTIQRPAAPPLTLSHYRGKIVLLIFIDTHCPHCQQLTGFLNGMAPKYESRGVQLLECAFNLDAGATIGTFQQQFHPAFPAGFSDRATVLGYLGIPLMERRPLYVPHLVFIDRRGIIRADIAGESDFMKQPEVNIPQQLDKMLKVPTTAR